MNDARWRMLGHVLRSSNDTPAYQSLYFAVFGCKSMKGRVGRHRTNLFDVILKDLYNRGITLKTEYDFYNLVELAQNRKVWKDLFYKTN